VYVFPGTSWSTNSAQAVEVIPVGKGFRRGDVRTPAETGWRAPLAYVWGVLAQKWRLG
jgi:hypothetical protein